MKTRTVKVFFLIFLLLTAALACSISYSPDQKEESGPESDLPIPDINQGIVEDTGTGEEAPVSRNEVLAAPVGLNEGLSSLNSYTYTLQIIANGPSSQDRSETKILSSKDNSDSNMTRIEMISSSAEEPEVDTSVSTNYRVGNINCTIDDGDEAEAETEDYSPAAKEMLNILGGLWDVHFKTGDPVFIGNEVVNGINCKHFTFNVGGLGKTSGAEVTQSTGEYWSAVDGNYIVKYDVVLETRNAPEGSIDAEVLHSEIHYLLYDINNAASIVLPSLCN